MLPSMERGVISSYEALYSICYRTILLKTKSLCFIRCLVGVLSVVFLGCTRPKQASMYGLKNTLEPSGSRLTKPDKLGLRSLERSF